MGQRDAEMQDVRCGPHPLLDGGGWQTYLISIDIKSGIEVELRANFIKLIDERMYKTTPEPRLKRHLHKHQPAFHGGKCRLEALPNAFKPPLEKGSIV